MDIQEKTYEKTKLLYMDDTYLFTCPAKVIEIAELEDGKIAVILDQTIFYPQGGGQPYDLGFINSAIPITAMLTTKGELSKYCSSTPDYIPEGKPVRIVIFEGFPAIPCGETHVRNTKEIGKLEVKDIASKKGNIRVKYSIA